MFVPVAFVQVRFVGVKFDTNKFVKVAFVPETDCRKVGPVTVNVDVTVEEPATNPPYKYCCNVVVALQFAPFERHTLKPFTEMADAFKVVPEAVAKPSQDVEVTLVSVALEPVSVPSEVAPSTVSVEVTVELEARNPP